LRTDPFGNPRNSTPWPSSKGFVGGTTDPTGLTHLGAREYDPGIGRFLSRDPLVNAANPQQINGYSYAGNTPVTAADPSGLMYQPMEGRDLNAAAGHVPGCQTPNCDHVTPPPTPSGGGSRGYGTTVSNPMACATRLCHDQQAAYAQQIAQQAEQQRRDALRASMNCATLLCHQQMVNAVANGQYDAVKVGPDWVTVSGGSIVTYTPKAVFRPALTKGLVHGCTGGWDCLAHPSVRLPDYYTLDVAGFMADPWCGCSAGGGLVVTVTRGGSLFVGWQGGTGSPGISGAVRGGYIGGPFSGYHSNDEINSYVNGNGITAAVDMPGCLSLLCSVAANWGDLSDVNPRENFSTEFGVGIGSPGTSLTYAYEWHTADLW